jgi:hypothetical protein
MSLCPSFITISRSDLPSGKIENFTPLESPAACSGDKDEFLLKRTRG